MSSERIVVITGASGGIGLCTAQAFLKRGDTVYSLSRSAPPDPAVRHIPTDVTDEAAVNAAILQVQSEAGRIDVLVLNAGMGVSGAVEFTALSEAQRQFDVCFFGAMRTMQAALPALRQSKGMAIFVSSVAAATPIPFQAYYSAAKAAIVSMVGALRGELNGTGVRVCAILPGDVKTGFTQNRRKCAVGAEVYPSLTRSVARMEHDEQHGMAPARIASAIVKTASKRRPKPYRSVGFAYRAVLVLQKLLPARFVSFVLGKLYAS